MGDMRERLMPVFLEEAAENLGSIEQCLNTLGKVGDESQDLLEPAFRSAHTIKGTAALVKLAATSTIALRLEDALEHLNLTGNIPSAAELKALRCAFDALKALVACAANNEPEPPGVLDEVDRVFREAEKATPRASFSILPDTGDNEEVLPFKLPETSVREPAEPEKASEMPVQAPVEEPSEEWEEESVDIFQEEETPLEDVTLTPSPEIGEDETAAPEAEETLEEPSEAVDPLIEDTSPRVALVGFSCCHFQVGGTEYYLPIENMLEITPLPSLTFLPMAPEYILGLANLRGMVVPVIHLGRLHGVRTASDLDKHLIVAISGNEKVGFFAEGMPDLAVDKRGQRIDPQDFIQRHKVGAA